MPPDTPTEPRWNNAVTMLTELAEEDGERSAFVLLDDSLQEKGARSLQEIVRRACSIAGTLGKRFDRGARVLLAYPAGLEFIDAFFGCLMAGMLAVPLPMPKRRRGDERFGTIAEHCQAAACLTTHESTPLFASVRGSGMELIESDRLQHSESDRWFMTPEPGQVAYLQYTSGSTGTPKGVIVSHRNLMANLEMIRRGFEFSPNERLVTWLPHYHDMGLVGDTISSIYSSVFCIRMTPQSFIRDPLSWLRAASLHKATIIGAPNFAYEVCARSAQSGDIGEMDLSSVAHAYCGAEQIQPDTLERFVGVFSRRGLRAECLRPCYGLAEATLCVAVGARGGELQVRERPNSPGMSGPAGKIVSCGRPVPPVEVRIVDENSGAALADGQVGEIEVNGENVSCGYWGGVEVRGGRLVGEDSSRALRTGDLGFVETGQLYVTGRKKDMMIVGGRKLYPQDIESSAGRAHEAVETLAVFAVNSGDGDRIVAIVEVDRRLRNGDLSLLRQAIHQSVLEDHDVSLSEVVFVTPFSIPRTPSGKVQRFACRQNYQSGDVPGVIRGSGLSAQASSATGRCDDLADYVRKWAAKNLGFEPTVITGSSRLSELGLDSLRAVDLQLSLLRDRGLSVSASALADGVTISELASRSLQFAIPEGPPLAVLAAKETIDLRFNVMPGRFVQETLHVREYRVWKGYAEALFDRDYRSEMLASPDHLIFLTALAHTQKLAYVYMAHQLGFNYSGGGAERFKFWPTDVRVTMPQMISENKGLRHQIWAYDKRQVGDNKFMVKCRSLIGSMEILIDSMMLMLGGV